MFVRKRKIYDEPFRTCSVTSFSPKGCAALRITVSAIYITGMDEWNFMNFGVEIMQSDLRP
jgi:hypothetical protein